MNSKKAENAAYPQLRLVKDLSSAKDVDLPVPAAEPLAKETAKRPLRSAFARQMQNFSDDLDRHIEEILRS